MQWHSSYCHGYLRKKLRIKSLNCGPHKKPIYSLRRCVRAVNETWSRRTDFTYRLISVIGTSLGTKVDNFFLFFSFSFSLHFFFFWESNLFYYRSKRGLHFFFIQMYACFDDFEDVEPTFFYIRESNDGFYWILNFFQDAFHY